MDKTKPDGPVIDFTSPTFHGNIQEVRIDGNVFTEVEIEPAFPGGDAAWKKYLEKNLDHAIPSKNGAPKGIYTVYVEFIVDAEGNISNITQLTNHGFGMEQEAIRMIKMTPRWIPALQDGQKVKAMKRQHIVFTVSTNSKLPSEKQWKEASGHSNSG